MTITIEEVRGRRGIKQFIDLPFRLYRNDPYWVAPLRSEVRDLLVAGRHPVHESCTVWPLVARRAGAVVGRLAAIRNDAHNRCHGDRVGFFGFFECEDDREVSRALLDAAREKLSNERLERIRGPVSPTIHYECGLLVEGRAGIPVLKMPYNPSWYAGLIEGAGLTKCMDLFALWVDRESLRRDPKVQRIIESLESRPGLRVRPLDRRRFDRDVGIMHRIYNDAWVDNWGHHPMSEAEFRQEAKGLAYLAEEPLALFAEEDGEAAAFLIALRDVNPALRKMRGRLLSPGLLTLLRLRRSAPLMRVAIAGALPGKRGRGLMAMLYNQIIEAGLARGIHECEMSWVLETNHLMLRTAQAFGAQAYRTYRIYEGPLSAGPGSS